jgi:phage gpG-like protein
MKCGDTTSLQFNRKSVTKTDNRNLYLICCNKLYAGFHNKGLNKKKP